MKKKRLLAGAISMLSLLALVGCNATNNSTSGNNTSNTVVTTTTVTPSSSTTTTSESSSTSIVTTTQDSNATDVTEDVTTTTFSITTDDGNFSQSGSTYTITSAGTYTVTGSLTDGNIIVNAGDDDKVIIELSESYIKSTTTAPINVLNADKVEVKAKKDTTNVIVDGRSSSSTDEYSAAIYSDCDLELSGKGTLSVYGYFNNGVQSKDDLEVKNLTLKCVAVNNSLKGNDSVTVESGTLNIISTDGDGISTSNSSVSSKGNQKGTVTISGGTVNVYASEDGIDAAYDAVISDEAVVNIYTDSYSTYTGTSISSISNTTLYVRIKASMVNTSNYRYVIYQYGDDADEGVFQTLTQVSKNSSYYYYQTSLSSNYSNIVVFRYLASQTENSTTTYDARSEGQTINTSKNMFVLNSVSSSIIKVDWGTYQTSSSGASTTVDKSSKGIKADNEVTISGSVALTISSTDDGIHANNDVTLDNNSKGTGNVTISGGTLYIISGDDGIHADNILTISAGDINVTKSYEGLEGDYIYINGTAKATVYATDDGINASKLIQVEGDCYVDVTVPSGDTDGIDSNGNYIQKGGTVISRCAVTDTSGNMAALDIDGTFTMTGGTYIGVGPIAAKPSSSSVNYITFGSSGGMSGRPGFGGMGGSSSSSNYSFGSGTWTLKSSDGTVIATFTLSQSYSNLLIASASLAKNSSYTLTNGTTTYTWTQSSQGQSYSS